MCLQIDGLCIEDVALRHAADLNTHFNHVMDTLQHFATRPPSPLSEKVGKVHFLTDILILICSNF